MPPPAGPITRTAARALGLSLAEIDLEIHPRDEMFADALRLVDGDRDTATADYLRLGAEVAALTDDLVAGAFGGWQSAPSVLDFASGYGRVARHLRRRVSPERLAVADVLADAMRFQRERFGFEALLSTTDPAAFATDRRFDLVFVNSLFTHLPEARFHAWLERLAALRTPEGIVAFTAHDLAARPLQFRPTASGILFRPESESATLDASEYGVAWVSESFVRSAAARAAPRSQLRRYPRAVAGFQDLYVLGTATALDRIALDPGPEGFVDRATFDAATGDVVVSGWAWDRSRARRAAAVELWLGEDPPIRFVEFTPRPDAAPAFPAPAGAATEWKIALSARARDSIGGESCVIVARGASGRGRILFAGRVERLWLAVARLERDAYRARSQRFEVRMLSPVRDLWTALRRRLRGSGPA